MTAAAGSDEGILEELDGTPIGPPPVRSVPAGAANPWYRGFAAATAMTARRPGLWILALVAFLTRGGLVALVVPIVVLPTFVGLANFVGPASVSPEGPGPRLVALIVAGLAAGFVLLVVGTVIAAAAEVALHRATAATREARSVGSIAAGGAGATRAAASSTGLVVARVAALRLVLLVPVAAAIAYAIPAWVAVGYRELTVPSEVVTPLVVRVLAGAPAASSAVLGAWLAAEVVGGFAARRAALLGAPIARALGAGLLDPFRAPLGTILTVAAAVGTGTVVLVPVWWALGGTWAAARHLIGSGNDLLPALGAALLLAAAWLVGLVLAALAAAWRASLVTMELLRRRR
ncbi:MAG TPA: hypothetical protein VLM76_06710 [Patescibacteria group bacterium]|nr:hypothetical protein [Patescibacteria group bacterium]